MNHLQDEDGIRSIPTITTWRSIREDIAAAFESVAGPLPTGEKCDLAMKVEEEVDCGSYVRQLITYAATENCRTPAYLCIPKACLSDAPTRAPAVLCLHGTDQEVGHGTVVGLSDKENRSYASELAERGFVTLAPSYPLLANYQEEPAAHGFESGTMMAIHDNMRGLDLLDTLPFVANQTPPRPPNLNGTALPGDYYEWGSGGGHYMPGKYGAIGHSSAPPSATPLPTPTHPTPPDPPGVLDQARRPQQRLHRPVRPAPRGRRQQLRPRQLPRLHGRGRHRLDADTLPPQDPRPASHRGQHHPSHPLGLS